MTEPEVPRQVGSQPSSPPTPSKPPPPFTPHFAVEPPAAALFSGPWLIGAGALIVALVALFLVFRGSDDEPVAPSEPETTPPSTPSPAPSGKVELLPPAPLDISRLANDARQRSDTWNRNSELSGASLLIENGKPEGALVFVFGVPRGASVPAAVLLPERFTVTYDQGRASSEESRAGTVGHALSEPNCPLDAAFRQAVQSGLPAAVRLTAEYSYSLKHSRGVWTFTPASGATRHVDADNCAILVR